MAVCTVHVMYFIGVLGQKAPQTQNHKEKKSDESFCGFRRTPKKRNEFSKFT